MKTSFCLCLLILFAHSIAFTQPNKKKQNDPKYDPLHLTKEQKLADSIQFEKFKKENPEAFKNKRLAVSLADGSSLVNGYLSNIQIKNNYITDSVYHNFHPGMPDTSTLIPYNEIKVSDAKINIVLFSHLLLNSSKQNTQPYIDPFPESLIKNGKVDNLPVNDYGKVAYAIRASINGKIIFDWKKLNDFTKQPYEVGQKFPVPGDLFDYHGVSSKGFSYGYNICDTSLLINDQLLVEIKNTKNNWMVDKYNIRRVAIKPFLATVFANVGKEEQHIKEFSIHGPSQITERLVMIDSLYFGWEGNGLSMNNEFYSSTTTLEFFFRKPTPNYPDSIQYKLIGKQGAESEWINSIRHIIVLNEVLVNTYNELQVRYKNTPENVASYRWTVKPRWYETIAFKLITGAVILLFLILIAIFIHKARLKKEKERRSKLNMELRSIQSQLNPHFIFNSLNSIQSLINSNNIIAANEYLSEFSNLMRNTLTDSNKVFQTLNNEIKILDIYLKLEQLRFEFEYNITTDGNINKNNTEIPTLLLQPLVENAVKHGVSELREKGKVNIHFYSDNSVLIVEIKDNGKGFIDEKKAVGYGLKLTDEKIQLLNRMLKGQGIEKKIFRKNEETIVQIIFKNWL